MSAVDKESIVDTINRCKLIEAQQKSLIKKRLESQEEIEDESPNIYKVISQQTHNSITRTNVPPPLSFDLNRKIPMALTSAPPLRMDYPMVWVPTRNVYYSPYRVSKSPVLKSILKKSNSNNTPRSAPLVNRKKNSGLPIVTDIFNNKNDTTKKLAPYESQPWSTRKEYFAINDEEINDEISSSYNSDSEELEDDGDNNVEDCAIEENAEINNNQISQTGSLPCNFTIGSDSYDFELPNVPHQHSMDSKMIFLNHCAIIWNKFNEKEKLIS